MTVIQALGPLGVGVALSAIIGGLFLMRKNRAETGKLNSESGKLAAEAAQIIADAAGGLVAPLHTQVGALGQQVIDQGKRISILEAEDKRKAGLLDSAGVVIRDFLSCGVPDCPVVAKSHTIPPDLRIEVKK